MVDTLEIIVPSLCAMLCKQIMSGDVIARLIRASVSQSVHSRLRAYVCVTSNQQPVNSDQRPEMSLHLVSHNLVAPASRGRRIRFSGSGGLQTIICIRFFFGGLVASKPLLL